MLVSEATLQVKAVLNVLLNFITDIEYMPFARCVTDKLAFTSETGVCKVKHAYSFL